MPTFVNGGHNSNFGTPGAPTLTMAVTIPATAADSDLVVVSTTSHATAPPGVASVVATGAQFAQVATREEFSPFTLNGVMDATARVEMWIARAVTAGIVLVTVTWTAVACGTVEVGEYSGVQSLGQVVTVGTTLSDPSLALATQDANNIVVAGFAGAEGATGPFTAKTGNFRENDISNATFLESFGALVDNTSATPATVTCAVTHASVNHEMAAAMIALELRSVGTAIPIRRAGVYA